MTSVMPQPSMTIGAPTAFVVLAPVLSVAAEC